MKNSKLMNPVLIAQEATREAMLQIGEYIQTFANKLYIEGWIDDYSVEVLPWNNGYEIVAKLQLDYGKLHKLYDSGEKDKLKILNSLHLLKFHLQPDSFFNDKIVDGKALIEGRNLNLEGDTDRWETYVAGEYSILQAANYFKDRNIHQVSQWYNTFFA